MVVGSIAFLLTALGPDPALMFALQFYSAAWDMAGSKAVKWIGAAKVAGSRRVDEERSGALLWWLLGQKGIVDGIGAGRRQRMGAYISQGWG